MKITNESQFKEGVMYWHVSAVNGANLVFKASKPDDYVGHNFEGNIVFDNKDEAQQMADSLNNLLKPHLFHKDESK